MELTGHQERELLPITHIQRERPAALRAEALEGPSRAALLLLPVPAVHTTVLPAATTAGEVPIAVAAARTARQAAALTVAAHTAEEAVDTAVAAALTAGTDNLQRKHCQLHLIS